MTQLRDKVIIITGASMGLGRELAVQLATLGARLVLAARSLEQLTQTAEECRQRGAPAIAVPTDITQLPQCKALVDTTIERFGRLDVLINNAGISMTARFEDVADPSLYAHIVTTNYLGSVYTTHYALPHLTKTAGRIVAVSSLAGKTGVPWYSAYCASKHALVGFYESLRIEVEDQGISVTLIFPDFVATGIHTRSMDARGEVLGGNHGIRYEHAMGVETCAGQIIHAMDRRRRDVLMSTRGKIGQWIKLVAPRAIDRMALRAMQKGK